MNKDYSILLENLLGRRYDEALRESIVSEAFEESEYPECVLYALEAMEEIDPSYSYKTFHLAKRIQDKIAERLKQVNLRVDFRYQGDIQTETHIVLYGGVELIVLTKALDNKPWKRINQITQEVMDLLTSDGSYKEVNFSSKLKIKLTTLKPSCEINILPAVWLDNYEYTKSNREIERGICEYNLAQKTRRKYLPFLNIARINSRDARCNGGLKRLIRLLRTLQRDAHNTIDLSNHEIAGALYAIPEKQMKFNSEYSLSLLGVASAQLNRLVTDRVYRETLLSPSKKELVFGSKESKVNELQKLKIELDNLIEDLQEELRKQNKTLYSDIRYN